VAQNQWPTTCLGNMVEVWGPLDKCGFIRVRNPCRLPSALDFTTVWDFDEQIVERWGGEKLPCRVINDGAIVEPVRARRHRRFAHRFCFFDEANRIELWSVQRHLQVPRSPADNCTCFARPGSYGSIALGPGDVLSSGCKVHILPGPSCHPL